MQHFIDDKIFALLKRESEKISLHYYSQVYLIGSCLETKDYRDVDIVVVMKDEHFFMRFGNEINLNKKLSIERLKIWEKLSNVTGLLIDFKIFPISYFNKIIGNKNKMQIDTGTFNF